MADANAATTFRNAAAFLTDQGLGELFSVDANGNPGGWLWQQIISGRETFEEIVAAIERTDVWQNRFSVIVEQRRRRAAGENVVPLSPAELLDYEETFQNLMRNANMPAWLYKDRDVAHKAVLSGLSPMEVEDRIAGVITTVNAIDPDVAATFRKFYGVGQGDAALAAYFLDPDKTEKELDKVALASRAGAMADDFGFGITKTQAEMFSLFDRTAAGIAQDLTEINTQTGLMSEGHGEAEDITLNDGFDAVVLGNADARRKLEGRLLRRQANARAGGGGALSTQDGLLGVSTAK